MLLIIGISWRVLDFLNYWGSVSCFPAKGSSLVPQFSSDTSDRESSTWEFLGDPLMNNFFHRKSVTHSTTSFGGKPNYGGVIRPVLVCLGK